MRKSDRRKFLSLIILFYICKLATAQPPVFGPEIPVTINGYTLDAMEPFISPDGNAMFFNSLNNGVNTSLYYAVRSNDSTFNLVGLMPVVNETVTPYLNAVASLDSLGNFFWVSTRNYPADYDNLHKVTFASSTAYNFARVHGNIYVYSPGWIIMDAAINHDGNYLYYCNAYFNNCGGLPCFAKLGIGQKVNDSTFAKLPNSNTILAAINDTTNYIIYAPNITKDGLELYYTRVAIGTTQTEIMVATRTNTSSAFGTPSLIYTSLPEAPEAPTLTTDKQKLYYHKVVGGKYKLILRYRSGATGISYTGKENFARIYPNPASEKVSCEVNSNSSCTLKLINSTGITVLERRFNKKTEVNVSGFSHGVYILELNDGENVHREKVIIR